MEDLNKGNVVLVGQIEGNNVYIYVNTDVVVCKKTLIPASSLLEAYHSSMDRVSILLPSGIGEYNEEQNHIVLRKHDNSISLGCFEVSKREVNKLFKKIENARVNKTN